MMRAIKKILVPVDGSVGGCKAVDEALFIAEKCDAELDFVYVASNINKDIPSHIVFDRIWEKLSDERKARKHVKSGNIARSILDVADEQGSDMIVMGSRGLGLLKGVLIGSVSQKVVEEAQIPVMVVK
ncbi:universal stress protein [uncultured Selenomonas sp.]|uniref:universal stress protein n=1 Tax=uncultured Selenomonas sp. TaxID=159275 RepID=UPI0028DC89D7|nr:universal stress protein [uncultured Selenomonas sp.]